MAGVRGQTRTTNADEFDRDVVLTKVERLLLSGVTNLAEIGAAFNRSVQTASLWVKEIRERWEKEREQDLERRMDLRVRQIENLAILALDSYERSKEDSREYTTVTKVCEFCKGDGVVEVSGKEFGEKKKQVCSHCSGEGKSIIETMKIAGKPGDGRFLSIAKECFVELTKLEGLHPQQATIRKLVAKSQEVGGEMQTEVEEIYLSAPVDTIIRAKAMLSELKELQSKGQASISKTPPLIVERVRTTEEGE